MARSDALIEQEIAGIHGVIVEARNQMPRLEARRFHCRLRVHTELDHVEQN